MMLERYLPNDVVPQEVIAEWKKGFKADVKNCSKELVEFIDAVAKELGDFEQIGKSIEYITGYELILANINEINGEKVTYSTLYPIEVPDMIAVDHRSAMYRIYNRQGKNGLINYCRVKTSPRAFKALAKIIDKL